MCNSSMEERKCTNCKVCKTGEEFNGMNKQCIQCLDKSKEFHKKNLKRKYSVIFAYATLNDAGCQNT
jgi:uncharacterized membrane protein YvbJ